MANFIDVVDGHMPSELCRTIIDKFESEKEHQYEGVVGYGSGKSKITHETKKCTEIWITRHLDSWEDIDTAMFELVGDAIRKTVDRYPGFEYIAQPFRDDGYRVKRYANDGTEKFAFHVDVNGYVQADRVLVCQWYLNTVEEGGETVFPAQEVEVKPVEGRLVTFPPFWTHSHEAKPPVSEPKYIISSWVQFPKISSPRTTERVVKG